MDSGAAQKSGGGSKAGRRTAAFLQKAWRKTFRTAAAGSGGIRGLGSCETGLRKKTVVEARRDGKRRPFCKKAWRKTFRTAAAGRAGYGDWDPVGRGGAKAGVEARRGAGKSGGRKRAWALSAPHAPVYSVCRSRTREKSRSDAPAGSDCASRADQLPHSTLISLNSVRMSSTRVRFFFSPSAENTIPP